MREKRNESCLPPPTIHCINAVWNKYWPVVLIRSSELAEDVSSGMRPWMRQRSLDFTLQNDVGSGKSSYNYPRGGEASRVQSKFGSCIENDIESPALQEIISDWRESTGVYLRDGRITDGMQQEISACRCRFLRAWSLPVATSLSLEIHFRSVIQGNLSRVLVAGAGASFNVWKTLVAFLQLCGAVLIGCNKLADELEAWHDCSNSAAVFEAQSVEAHKLSELNEVAGLDTGIPLV
ncbi:hypothetical protein B0H14DRAFT_2617594 [Mycena olivaceomarginata]|nr:hypothetical protein B0H14DRAFT_2617594 [Mycena olivaceomarginata]